jgi:nucleoside-diphosphate-sugar epimerase
LKIALTGAAGGIGRSLMGILGEAHELTGIVRTPRAGGPAGRYVAFIDKPAVAAAFAEADCVIHCAIDTRARRRDFLPANRAMNQEVLDGTLGGQCRLFIFVSSQVVYSGTDPADADGYREDQPLVLSPRADNYTRLKIESEREVIAACTRAGIDYLILRPTIVMGPGMDWSTGVVSAFRGAVLGIRNRTMNLVHVDDLSRQVRFLIEGNTRNDVFNLGTLSVSTEDYFRQVGVAAGLPTLFLPNWLVSAMRGFIPSTIWMFAHDVAINGDKVAEATGFRSDRPLQDYFPHRPVLYRPQTLDAVRHGCSRSAGFPCVWARLSSLVQSSGRGRHDRDARL